MRSEGQHRHPDTPDLSQTSQLGIGFDLVLLSAVWKHVASTAEKTGECDLGHSQCSLPSAL
jgi:hypothetical protein